MSISDESLSSDHQRSSKVINGSHQRTPITPVAIRPIADDRISLENNAGELQMIGWDSRLATYPKLRMMIII